MLPLQELLHRIKWDVEFGKGAFTVGYYDRVVHEEHLVPFVSIRLDPQWPDTFSFHDEDGIVRHIPLHRVRTVYKDGVVVWRRPGHSALCLQRFHTGRQQPLEPEANTFIVGVYRALVDEGVAKIANAASHPGSRRNGATIHVLSCRVAMGVLRPASGYYMGRAPSWTPGRRDEESAMTLQLTTPAFKPGTDIPAQYTCDGSDTSPALSWSTPPEGTRSFAMILDDPDAPGGTWVHWVLYDLPPTERELPAGVPPESQLPSGARQGRNDFGRTGYGGPCPPPGPAHRYYFKLYALDKKLELRPGSTRAQADRSMRGHILAHAELMGWYHRT